MIRVLHVISGLGPGGSEGVVTRLVTQGDPDAVESGVVSLTDEGVHGATLRRAGIPLWIARMPRGLPTPGYRRSLRRAVSEFHPDLICGWLYRGNMAALAASRDAGGVPVVWNIRHSLHDWTREPILFRLTVLANRWQIRRPDLVIYNSFVARDQHREFGFLPQADRVVPNGFDLDRFKPDPEGRVALRQEWQLEADQVAVGLVARWHPIKNHAGFLAAAANCLQTYPSTVFVLAGEGCDEHNPALMALVDRYGLMGHVRLLGRVDRIERVTAALDLAVNASFGEAFSNAVGEALACGVPCLTTAVGDSRRIVADNGWSVEPGALAEGLIAMVALGRDGLEAKARGSRKRMETDYSLATMKETYSEVFLSIQRSKS